MPIVNLQFCGSTRVNNGKARLKSVTAHRVPGFQEKSFRAAWLSDSAVCQPNSSKFLILINTFFYIEQCYPLMAVLAFAFIFPAAAGLYKIRTDPDARISRSTRKSILRGGPKDEP